MISLSGARIWTLAALFLATQAAPSRMVRRWKEIYEKVKSYLIVYKYLRPFANKTLTEDKIKEAIRRMQKFGGVKPTGIVDASTFSLLGKKRCGLPDFTPGEKVRRYTAQGQTWKKKDLTWSINLWSDNLSNEVVRSEMTSAFEVWNKVSLLSFREVQRMDADIVVSFVRGKHEQDQWAFDGRGHVLAHAFFPGEGIGGDAHFDDDEPFVDKVVPGVDGVRLFAVAAHEFGHSLGLSHSAAQGALMNPFYQAIPDDYQLPYDDAVGIHSLYGANPQYQLPTTTKEPVTTIGPPPVTTPYYPKPQTCNTSYDAVSVIRSELYIFKGRFFWRLTSKGLLGNYPFEINHFWQNNELETVDAAYERPTDGKIVFFSGSQYFLFDGVKKEDGYPQPLTDLGLPRRVRRIDAVMVWGFNGKTYIFAGSEYWRYDEKRGRVEVGYPRDMALWRGVPTNIDAAFQHTDGRTYFFKGRKFWEFNDNKMKLVLNKVRNVNEYWLKCTNQAEGYDLEEDGEGETDVLTTSNSRINSESCI